MKSKVDQEPTVSLVKRKIEYLKTIYMHNSPPIDSPPSQHSISTTSMYSAPNNKELLTKVLFTSESDPDCYEATKAVVKEAQIKFYI